MNLLFVLGRSLMVLTCGLAILVLTGCEIGGERKFSVIAGPSVPSGNPTAVPLVWDAREELDIWVNNPVTRGPVRVSLVGDGVQAAIRIEPRLGADGFVLRGPDLTPPVVGTRAVRIWYRWLVDPALSPTASRTFGVSAIFEALNPPWPPAQPSNHKALQPAADWTLAEFLAGPNPLLDVKYVYFHQSSNNPGVFEIDRIELVRAGGS